MYCFDDTMVTGGKDDRVVMWDTSVFPFVQRHAITRVGTWVWGYTCFPLRSPVC